MVSRLLQPVVDTNLWVVTMSLFSFVAPTVHMGMNTHEMLPRQGLSNGGMCCVPRRKLYCHQCLWILRSGCMWANISQFGLNPLRDRITRSVCKDGTNCFGRGACTEANVPSIFHCYKGPKPALKPDQKAARWKYCRYGGVVLWGRFVPVYAI